MRCSSETGGKEWSLLPGGVTRSSFRFLNSGSAAVSMTIGEVER